MAKRARGTTSRPGQRAPIRRTSATGVPAPAPAAEPAAVRPASLTADEEARAAELEARIVAAERSAEEASRRRGRRAPVDGPGIERGGSIALRAAEEYAYVMRDVRRIVLIGGSLIALLIALWVVTQVTGSSLV